MSAAPIVRVAKGLGLLLAGLLVTLTLLLVMLESLDWNQWRDAIARKSQETLGRKLVIEGDLEIHLLTLTPELRATRVAFENAAWGTKPHMFEAEQVLIEIRLLPLLRGQLDFTQVGLQNATLLLERNAEGRGNWELDSLTPARPSNPVEAAAKVAAADAAPRSDVGSLRLPLVRDIRIRDAGFTYINHQTGRTTNARIALLTTHAETRTSPTSLIGHGSLDGLPFQLDALLGSTDELAHRRSAFPFEIDASLGGLGLRLKGHIAEFTTLSGLDASFHLIGENLAPVFEAFGLPHGRDVPLVRAKGRIVTHQQALSMSQLDVRLGGSQAKGTLAFDLSRSQPHLSANLELPRLRIQDIQAFLPQSPPRPAAPGGAPVWYDSPHSLPLELLHTLNLDARIGIRHIEGSHLAQLVNDLDMQATIKHGVLQIQPLGASLAGGRLELSGVADATQPAFGLKANTAIIGIDIAQLIAPYFGNRRLLGESVTQLVTGRAAASAALTAVGRTPRELVTTLGGQAAFALGDGLISNAIVQALPPSLLALTGLHAQPHGQPTKLRCLLGRFRVDHGVIWAEPLILGLPHRHIVVTGQLDLASEALALELRSFPRGRKFVLTKAARPLSIHGTVLGARSTPFSHLVIRKLSRPAAKRTAPDLGTLLEPLSGLDPLVAAGLGSTSHCATYAAEIASMRAKLPGLTP